MTDVLGELTKAGVSVWLDDISRERLRTGNLAALIRDFHVRGVTSNPTIFANALAGRRLRRADQGPGRPRRHRRGGRPDDHHLRHALGAPTSCARSTTRPAAWTAGSRSRSTRGSPARPARPSPRPSSCGGWSTGRTCSSRSRRPPRACPAITAVLAEGISVNVTLIFSLERYGEVMDAYIAGLEQAEANGHDISKIASVASFFCRRVDTEVDKRLNKIGTPEAAGAQGQGRHRQRAARLRAVRAEARHRPLGGARRPRAPRCSARCGPRPPPRTRRTRHHVRGRPGGRRHRQHDAGGDAARHGRPRRAAAATPCTAPTRSPARCSPPRGARHLLRRRGQGPRGRGRGEVRGRRGTNCSPTIQNELSLNS